MESSRRRFLTVLALGAVAAQGTGCIGSFGLFNKVLDWNKGVSGNKFLNWLVFLAFLIVPVYEFVLLADFLVLNSIEFWSGKNPISDASGAPGERRVAQLDAEHVLEMQRSEDGRTVHLCSLAWTAHPGPVTSGMARTRWRCSRERRVSAKCTWTHPAH
jgi:hypothetical protein